MSTAPARDATEPSSDRHRREQESNGDSLWSWISSKVTFGTHRLKDSLRKQLYLSIEVEQLINTHADDEAKRHEEVQKALGQALEKQDNWREAYRAQQLLVGLMNRDTLIHEAQHRIKNAEFVPLDTLDEFRAELAEMRADNYPSETRLRCMVLRLISDTQWVQTRKFVERKFAAIYVSKVNLIWIVCTLGFLFSVLLFEYLPSSLPEEHPKPEPVYISPQSLHSNVTTGQGLTVADVPLVIQQKVDLLHLSGLWLALLTGLLGAAFSMIAMAQRRLEKISLEDLRVQSRWEFLLLRLGFGSGAAVILYFAFQSNLIAGVLFPDLKQLGVLQNDPEIGTAWGEWVPNSSLAALMVWSFVAGFSENFVPNILRSVEKPRKS